MRQSLSIRFRIEPDGATMAVTGRYAWALRELQKAGVQGCTPLSAPAPRWSAYVFVLRGMGLSIETISERHEGRFPGTHGRYVLRSQITVLEAAK